MHDGGPSSVVGGLKPQRPGLICTLSSHITLNPAAPSDYAGAFSGAKVRVFGNLTRGWRKFNELGCPENSGDMPRLMPWRHLCTWITYLRWMERENISVRNRITLKKCRLPLIIGKTLFNFSWIPSGIIAHYFAFLNNFLPAVAYYFSNSLIINLRGIICAGWKMRVFLSYRQCSVDIYHE